MNRVNHQTMSDTDPQPQQLSPVQLSHAEASATGTGMRSPSERPKIQTVLASPADWEAWEAEVRSAAEAAGIWLYVVGRPLNQFQPAKPQFLADYEYLPQRRPPSDRCKYNLLLYKEKHRDWESGYQLYTAARRAHYELLVSIKQSVTPAWFRSVVPYTDCYHLFLFLQRRFQPSPAWLAARIRRDYLRLKAGARNACTADERETWLETWRQLHHRAKKIVPREADFWDVDLRALYMDVAGLSDMQPMDDLGAMIDNAIGDVRMQAINKEIEELELVCSSKGKQWSNRAYKHNSIA